jgi:chromosome segregation ATPase
VGDAAGTALSPEATTQSDRKRLAEQLSALKRKEFELRRALAAADHPELADAIRLIEARAFVVARAETKLAQGFSKTEARRREVIEKKLGSLRDKRAELDTQIGTLETELRGLGSDRLATFGQERQEALKQLLIVLGTHEAALHDAGLDPASLVPEIEGWLPELEALASKVTGASA